MSIKKRGLSWVVRKQSNGQRCHLSYRSYDEACHTHRLLKENICTPNDIQPIKLEQAYDKCIAEAGHKGQAYKYQISQARKNIAYFSDCPLTEITQERIGEYRAFLSEQKLSNGTRNRRLSSLKKVISWANEKGHIKTTLKMTYFREGKKVYNPYTQDEIKKLFEYCETHNEPEIVLLLYILFSTGMRVGECLKLDINNDYHGEEGYIIIRESKNGDQRKVPVSNVLKKILSDLTPDEIERFHKLKYDQAEYRIGKIFKLVFPDREDATIHLIRHTVATNLVSSMSLAYVQKILGHKQIRTTVRYTHPSVKDLKEAIDECCLLNVVAA
ncbi:MAG: tyrosine-type recombinase/integrase [Candidatus Thiodiazotropha endolucinida]